jgi:ADP-ribose pyrophosphatase
VAHDYEVRSSEDAFNGKIIKVRTDQVTMPGGNESQRDVVIHPGAVGIVALDDQGRVMLIKQYRHPVKESIWELPAGLLDVEGELALNTAQRELSEEAGLQAEKWNVLVDVLTSPGMTNEATRIYLARDVSQTGNERSDVDEEADLELAWVELDEAVRSVLQGGIRNALAVAGLLAAKQAQDRNFENLREEQAPWPDRFDRVPQLVDRKGAQTPPQA